MGYWTIAASVLAAGVHARKLFPSRLASVGGGAQWPRLLLALTRPLCGA